MAGVADKGRLVKGPGAAGAITLSAGWFGKELGKAGQDRKSPVLILPDACKSMFEYGYV